MNAGTDQETFPACPEHSEANGSLRRSFIGGKILHFVQNDRFGVSLAIFVSMPLCLPFPPHPALSLRGRGFYRAFIKGKDWSGVFDAPEAGVGVGIALAKPISE